MAYSYVTGPYSVGWKGNSTIERKIRARLYYQITETPETYTIQVYGQCSIYKDKVSLLVGGKLNLTDLSQQYKTRQYSYSAVSTNETDRWYTICTTMKRDYPKNKTTRTVNASMKAFRDADENGWYSIASKSFTVPTKPNYAIIYDANGGTGSIANGKKWYKETFTLSDGSGFSKTGYTLSGWNTQADGNGTSYNKSASYTVDKSLTLYAIWTPNTYTVTYNKNNNSATGTTANSTHTYDVSKNLTANGYSLTDHLFVGWAVSADGGVIYTDKQSVKNLKDSGTYTLYAVWKNRYEAPDVQTTTAYRTESGNLNDTGSGASVQAYVVPGYKYSNLTTKAYVSTQIIASYRMVGNTGSYTQIGSVKTITTPQSISWTVSDNIFDPTKQYDIVITAKVVESNSVKISSTNSTFISVAEFTVDFDSEGASIGLFNFARGTVGTGDLTEKVVWVQGDMIFLLESRFATGTDHEILNLLTALGWDVDPTT